ELLDRLHGKGKHAAAATTSEKPAAEPKHTAAAEEKVEVEKTEVEKPTSDSAAKAPVARKKAETNNNNSHEKDLTETTVRVDTKRLDDIMNMVGELVLVRNRLVRLGLKSTDESMSKAVA